MSDLDAFFLPPARQFYDTTAAPDERREIDRIIRLICSDPYLDGDKKESFPYPPAAPVLYHDGRFYVVYDYENNWTLAIWDIGYDDDSLMVPRPPARD